MNQIWVGSDWHLWNTNNNYAHPYRSDTEIQQFIDKIDTLPIQKDDLVLFLGDFADILDPDPYKIQWILDKIPGTKIMVYGNHDIEDMSFWLTAGFDGVADMVTIHHMIFTHYPIHVGEEYINFHGHLHTEKFSQLDARWVNVYNPDIPFTRLDDVLEKIRYNNHIATHTDANIFPFEAKGIKDTMDKYTNVLDLSDEFPLVPQDESVIKNQEDIYYNKEKFDSGEINLCFITGHSGSGKSTMGRDMQQHGIEHYELDDLIFIKDHFTMANLKEYGGLIYSFFNGPGKKYYVTKKYVIDNNVPNSEYEDRVFIDFVNYAKRYAKSHPKTKFVVEGVWLFKPRWFKPEEFKDYAFYIKGTSMMISNIRAAKRNAKADHPTGGAKYQFEALRQTLAPDNLKWYIISEKQIQQYVKYFTRLMKQGNLNESIASTLDPNFVSKEPIKLSSLKRVRITKAVIDKYKSTYPDLRHVRCEDTKEYKCEGYIWLDNQGDLVAHVGSCEYNDDHTKWIVSLEVIPKFKGHGLAKQILDYATKTMHCKYLSVNKKNKLAKSIYDKYGFKVYYENENMYFMTIDPNQKAISESQTITAIREEYVPDQSSTLENDFTPGKRIKLSSLDKVRITKAVLDKYKSAYPSLRLIPYKNTKEYKVEGYAWFNQQDELVCHVSSCEYYHDKTKWITSLEVMQKFKGHGLSEQILDYATKTMDCKYLAVDKNNEVAKYIYDKYGFKVFHVDNEDDDVYLMSIDPNPRVLPIPESSRSLNEVLFDDVSDTEYWEQDDEHKLGSRKKEPMAEDYEEVKIKSTHEPRTKLKFLKEATEDVVRSLTESYITASPADGTADSLVAKPEVHKYRHRLWTKPLYQALPIDPGVPTSGSGWYASIDRAIKSLFRQGQIYVGQYYVIKLLPGHYDIRAGEEGPYWYFGGGNDEHPKYEIPGIIETFNSQESYYDWVTKYPEGKYTLAPKYGIFTHDKIEKTLQGEPIIESADDFDYDSPEVEDDAFGGEEVRFFNQEESYPTSTLDEEHHILTLDDSARFMNETTTTKSSYKKLYPVYINLFSNNTVFGKLIKTVTGSPYTHATIGLDSTMNNMYSFSGIPYNTAPLFLCSGFVRESIWSPAFTRCAFFHTYVTFVDKEGRDKIQKKINNFIKNYDKYDYNTPGLFEYYFGATNTKHHDENKKSMWFCSEFVTACVNASDEVEGFEDIMQSPEDLAHMPNTFDLGEWHVEDFDQKKMDILTKRAEAKFRKNPEMSSNILSEDASGSWIMDESAREKLRAVYKNAQNSGREVYNKMRQHDVHKYVFNLDWKKLHDEFVRLFPKNSPATRFDLIGLILHSYLIPTKQSIENVTENIVNQFKEIKKTVQDGYIKLLDIAKSIIFFWNKKLKDSALKYPSEELITESANEKYYTEPYSFRDKKYFKVTYNVLTGNTDTYYTDVSQSEDMLDNIIKIQPEDLDKLKIQFARDADELSTILATDYIKDTKLYQRIGALPVSSDFNFSIFSLLRITSVAQWNQEKYMESIRGLIPTDLTDEQFESYLLVRIKQLEEAMRFLTVLILENIALFGFTAADQARILSSGADRKDIKKAKRELDKQLLYELNTDPKTGTITYSLTSFGLGQVVISKNVYDENKDWLKPSRYIVRAAQYDYIIVAHGHTDNHDRWEIDPIMIDGKVYRYVDQLVHGLTRLGSKILITCCNPNDYQLAEQFASLDGIEYCNANVIMESVATTQYPDQLSKITDIELRKSIKAINVWRKNLINLLDERFDFICRMDVITLNLSDDLSTVKLITHSNTKPNLIKQLYGSTINGILSTYGELLSAMRVLINTRGINEGSYQVTAEKDIFGKKSYYQMIPAQHTLAEVIHEARLHVLANWQQYGNDIGTQAVITESGNIVKSFPLHDIGNDAHFDPELLADPPAEYEGLTEAATQKLYPVYVLLSHRSASALSNVIKALTHSQFSHAALSFDPKLTHMYSFGRNSPNSSKGSFRLESIKKDAYTMGEVPYSLYVVPCTAEQCKLIKKRLKYFAANKSNFTFDMAGLVKNGLGIESEPDDKWFCSRFVADVLNAGAPAGTKYIEHPSLMDPDDFRHTNFAQYVCGGLISDYDYLVAERITKDILHSAADARSQVGHLKNENTNMIIPSYIKYHNQIWHYKYANDPEDINYPDD